MIDTTISPLRLRMIEDMTICKFAPKTQQGDIRAVRNFSAFLGASPDFLQFEQANFATRSASSPGPDQSVHSTK